jgi:excisionase family DNA binding protein
LKAATIAPPAVTDDLRCLSVSQVASLLGISRAGVYVLFQRGELRSLHIGQRRLCTVEFVREFLRSRAAA